MILVVCGKKEITLFIAENGIELECANKIE